MSTTERLKKLSIPALRHILDCKMLSELSDEAKLYIPSKNAIFDSNRVMMHDAALEASIDEAVDPLDGYWYLLALIGLGAAGLYITIGVIACTAFYFCKKIRDKRKEHRAEVEEAIQFFQLSHLQVEAADTLLSKIHFKPLNLSTAEVKESMPKAASKSEAVIAGLRTGIAFFGAYYLSTAWIFEAIKLSFVTAAMTSAMALAIVGTIAFMIVVYCIYDHYKCEKNQNLVKYEHKKTVDIVQGKRDRALEGYSVFCYSASSPLPLVHRRQAKDGLHRPL